MTEKNLLKRIFSTWKTFLTSWNIYISCLFIYHKSCQFVNNIDKKFTNNSVLTYGIFSVEELFVGKLHFNLWKRFSTWKDHIFRFLCTKNSLITIFPSWKYKMPDILSIFNACVSFDSFLAVNNRESHLFKIYVIICQNNFNFLYDLYQYDRGDEKVFQLEKMIFEFFLILTFLIIIFSSWRKYLKCSVTYCHTVIKIKINLTINNSFRFWNVGMVCWYYELTVVCTTVRIIIVQ